MFPYLTKHKGTNFGGEMSCSQAEKCQRNLWSAWRWGMTWNDMEWPIAGDVEPQWILHVWIFSRMPNVLSVFSVVFWRSQSRCWDFFEESNVSIRTLLLDWVNASNCIKSIDDMLHCENHRNILCFHHIGTEMHRQTCPGAQRTTTRQWAPR